MAAKRPKPESTNLIDRLAEAVLDVLDDPPLERRMSGTMKRAPRDTVAEPPTSPGLTVPVFDEEPDTRRYLSGGSSGVMRRTDAERRTSRRVSLEVPVVLGLGDEVFTGTSEDISTTGLFVQTGRLLPSGRRVHLQFELPHGAIEVTGVVVRFRTPTKSVKAGIGICFQSISAEQLECIEAFCDAASDSIR